MSLALTVPVNVVCAVRCRYEDHAEIKIEVHTPANAQSVQLYFRGERMAKAIGSLAATQPEDLQAVSGVLVKRGFTHQLMAPGDITEFTELKTSVVRQRLCVAYRLPFSLLQFYLEQMYGNVKPFDQDNSPSLLVTLSPRHTKSQICILCVLLGVQLFFFPFR